MEATQMKHPEKGEYWREIATGTIFRITEIDLDDGVNFTELQKTAKEFWAEVVIDNDSTGITWERRADERLVCPIPASANFPYKYVIAPVMIMKEATIVAGHKNGVPPGTRQVITAYPHDEVPRARVIWSATAAMKDKKP